MVGWIPPGMDAHAVVNGALVAQSEWGGVVLHRDDVVQIRVRVHGGGGGSNPIAVILSLAIIIAAPYLAAALGPALGITSSIGLQLLGAGIAAAGLLVVNTLFPPRLPDPPQSIGQPAPQYSLSGGANRARPHEPLLMLLGSHRMYPDIVASEYTEYDENSDQFLNGIYDFGIGNLEIGPPRFGETPLSNFNSVSQQKQVNAITLVAGNVDTIAGGEFEAAYPNGRATGSPWITRRTAANTTSISFDLVSMHFIATNRGDLEGRTAFFQVQWREVGDSGWLFQNVDIVSPDGADARNAVRRTISTGRLDAAAYDVRVRIRANYDDDEDLSRITYRAAAPTIKAHQDETADFTGRNALALRVKATGQLYGRLDRINADVGAQVPDWDGTDWDTVRVTSNPASILLWWLRGYRVGNTLRAGYGLTDAQIDFTSLQLWHVFCAQQGLECNIVISDTRNEDEIAMLIAQCGWARLDISTGKYGVVYEDANRPVTAIINPANIVAGSIAISYDNENLADEVIGTYLDRDSDWQENTLRRDVPQFTITGEFPVTIRLEGVTSGEQAAKEINRAAAAQFYHQRQIVWEMDDEGRSIGIGDVVGMANGLLGNGEGGRLLTISSDRQTVTVPFDVSAASGSAWVWLLNDTVMSTTFTRTDTREIQLGAALAAAPSGVLDHPTAYRLMLFAATDPYTKARITGIDASGPHRFRFTARDELAQYYAFRTSDLTAPLIPIGEAYRPCPEGFVITQTAFGSRYFSWNEPDETNRGYELRYGPAGTAWGSMRPLHEGLLSGSPWTSEDRPDAGTWRFGLVAVYPDGQRCDPVYADATLTAAGRVTQYKEVEVYQVLAVTAADPANPSSLAADMRGSYDFDTETLTPPTGWTAGPGFPTFRANQQVWACTATADSAEGRTWIPDSDDWIGPYVVGDANDLDIIYRRLSMPPDAAPDSSESVPSGWFTNVADVPVGVDPIYVSIGHRRRGQKLYVWQLPTQLEGQSATTYIELDAYMVVAASASAPATPGASGGYNFTTETFTPPTGWVGPAFPAYGRNQVVYAVTATADNATDRTAWTAAAGDWLPNPPVVVGNADDLEIIYRRYTTAPNAAPAASAGIPTNWHNRVSSVPAGTGLIYQSIGHRQRGAKLYTWQLPTAIEALSIANITRNAETGVVTITYSDGTTDTFTVSDGVDGAALTVQSVTTDAAGNVTITFSDGTMATIAAGNAGRGIQSVSRNLTTGVVTITYDDGTAETFALEDGQDGADGSSQEWIYRATTTNVAPTTPVGQNTNDFVPGGWSDDPVSGDFVWVSTRRKPAGTGTSWGAFSTPASFRGEKGEPGDAAPRVWQLIWKDNDGYRFAASGTVTIPSHSDPSSYDVLYFVGANWNNRRRWRDFSLPTEVLSVSGTLETVETARLDEWRVNLDGQDINFTRVGGGASHEIWEVWGLNDPGGDPGGNPGGGTELSASISGPTTRTNDQSASYSVTVTGGTGTISYQWQRRTGTSGAWSNVSTASSYSVTRSTAGTYQVRCVVTRGSDTDTSNIVTTVWSAGTVDLPDAVAGTIAIGAVTTVTEGNRNQFTVTPSGGTYDTVTYAWSVWTGGGTITASGLYTAPQVAANTAATVRCIATFRGTGTVAESGTSATAADTEAFTISNVVAAGPTIVAAATVTVNGRPSAGATNVPVRLSANPTTNVVVTLSESNARLHLSSTSLTFTPLNGTVPQNVRFDTTGNLEGPEETIPVQLTASGGSTDTHTITVTLTAWTAPPPPPPPTGCFTADTPVWMADGTKRPIRDVVPGDRVQGRHGINTVHYLEYEDLEHDLTMYRLGGATITGNHAVLAEQGWCYIEGTAPGGGPAYDADGNEVRIDGSTGERGRNLVDGDRLAIGTDSWTDARMKPVTVPAETMVHSLVVDGGGTFLVGDGVVASGWVDGWWIIEDET